MQQQEQPTFRSFQSRNPATDEVVAEFPFLSDSDLTKVIDRSWKAYQSYKDTELEKRREKLRKLASIIEANNEKYAALMTQEMGKPITASRGEVQGAALLTRYYVDNAEEFLKPKEVLTATRRSLIEYRSTGPIYFIVPFNFPFFLSFVGTVPSLLIGNTVIYRPADSTPLLGKAIEELMHEAGFDNDLFQLVFSSPLQTEFVIANKYVRGVSFTGSTKAGQNIAAIAGKYTKKAVMELGGSDPFVVLDDADVEKAVKTALDSRLTNCGQMCCAGKRFIIDDRIYDRFREKLVQKVSELKVGDPMKPETELGPLARSDLRANIERQVQEGIKQGAKVLYGGKRPEEPELQSGNFYMPTICEVERTDNILLREETFGPVFTLMRVSGEEDMIRLANDTEYGLGAVIVSENLERAQKLGDKIETGTVSINGKVFPDWRTPFGGVKGSGFGRQYGEFGVHEFANIKTIMINQDQPVEK